MGCNKIDKQRSSAPPPPAPPSGTKLGFRSPADKDEVVQPFEVVKTSDVVWSDLVGIDTQVNTIRNAIERPTQWSALYPAHRSRPWRGMLMYGPPGCGKTTLAKAAAAATRAAFIPVKSSELMNSYLGGAEGRVKQLFEQAKEHESAIIFIDEIESLAGTRKDTDNEVTQRVKTELLIAMNGFGSSDRVLVIGGTNRPADIDPAFLRRMPKKIFVPMPDEQGLANMFCEKLKRTGTGFETAHYRAYAGRMKGHSGAAVLSVIKHAANLARVELTRVTHYREDPQTGEHLPCAESHPCSRSMPEQPLEWHKLRFKIKIRPAHVHAGIDLYLDTLDESNAHAQAWNALAQATMGGNP